MKKFLLSDKVQIGDLFYNLDATNKTAEVTEKPSGTYSGDIVIPATVDYDGTIYSVTSIGDYAFYGCTGLTSVTIPDGVKTIGDGAFAYCSGLTSVTIGENVTSIGNYAFTYCKGLTSITIPNSVTSIGWSAFEGCSGLTSINVAEDNPSYQSIDGVVFNKDMTQLIRYPGGKQGDYTIPNGVTSIGNYAFSGCTGLTPVTIPY